MRARAKLMPKGCFFFHANSLIPAHHPVICMWGERPHLVALVLDKREREQVAYSAPRRPSRVARSSADLHRLMPLVITVINDGRPEPVIGPLCPRGVAFRVPRHFCARPLPARASF